MPAAPVKQHFGSGHGSQPKVRDRCGQRAAKADRLGTCQIGSAAAVRRRGGISRAQERHGHIRNVVLEKVPRRRADEYNRGERGDLQD